MNKQLIRRFLATSALALAIPFCAQAQEASAPASNESRPAMGHPHHGKHHGKQHGRHHDQRTHGKHGMLMLRGLDLSQAQKDQLKALSDAGREAHRKQLESLQAARDALRKLSFSENYSPAEAAKLGKALAEQESAVLLARAEHGNKIYQILTPEQRSKLAERQSKARKPV